MKQPVRRRASHLAVAAAITLGLSTLGTAWAQPAPEPMDPSALPPTASTLNFTTGQTVANGVLVPICTPSCSSDLTILMGPAGAYLVIDVTGYLMPSP
jgi:hypothetical protein